MAGSSHSGFGAALGSYRANQGIWAFNLAALRDSLRAARAAPGLVLALLLIYVADYSDGYLLYFGEETPAYWAAFAAKSLVVVLLSIPIYLGLIRYIALDERPQGYFANLARSPAFRRTAFWYITLLAALVLCVAIAFLPYWFGVYATPFTLFGIVTFVLVCVRMPVAIVIAALDRSENPARKSLQLTSGYAWKIFGMGVVSIFLVLAVTLPGILIGLAIAFFVAPDIDGTTAYIGMMIANLAYTVPMDVFANVWAARLYLALTNEFL